MKNVQAREKALMLFGVVMGIWGGILGNFLVSSYYEPDYLTFGVDLVAIGITMGVLYWKINSLLNERRE